MSQMPRLLLLGDSHLARVRRARLRRLETATGHQVLNAARGGASVLDLVAQLVDAPPVAVAMLSVGTNDAAPWKQVPLETFRVTLAGVLPRVPASHIVYVGSPGVDEERLGRVNDRTNTRLREYVEVAAEAVRIRGGSYLDTAALLAPAEVDVFDHDGVHLNKAGYDRLLAALSASVSQDAATPGQP